MPIDSLSTRCSSPVLGWEHWNTQVLMCCEAPTDHRSRSPVTSLLHDGESDLEGRPFFGGTTDFDDDEDSLNLFSALFNFSLLTIFL